MNIGKAIEQLRWENGEHFIGMPIEQFVKKYLKNR